MNHLHLTKCGKCGSENLDMNRESGGMRITCNDCGRELFIPDSDEFLRALYLQMMKAASDIRENYIVTLWNRFNKG